MAIEADGLENYNNLKKGSLFKAEKHISAIRRGYDKETYELFLIREGNLIISLINNSKSFFIKNKFFYKGDFIYLDKNNINHIKKVEL